MNAWEELARSIVERGGQRSDDVRRAARSVLDAIRERDEYAKELRQRLLSGYDPSGCMHEVVVTVRYRDTRRQCQAGGHSVRRAFSGIFTFCTHHAAIYVAACTDVGRAEWALYEALELERSMQRNNLRVERQNPDPGVYVVFDHAAGRAKIGMTGDHQKRVSALRSAAAGQLHELAWFPNDDAWQLENFLHQHFADVRINPRGEWFRCEDPEAFAERAQLGAEEYANAGVE